ncbi:MAG: hypothetical protein QXS48_02840 [Candidatus Aenigmatarchaeota archaeon]
MDIQEEEAMWAEFQSTLEEAKEKTGLNGVQVLDIFMFELFRRDKEVQEPLTGHLIGLSFLTLLYSRPSLLNHSIVEGPGAPVRKILHNSSTFLDEEKIKGIQYFCDYFLIASIMPVPGKELSESILICRLSDRENPYKIGLINSSKEWGKKIKIQEYDKGIANPQLCTFRKFYGCNEIQTISTKELYEYTREKLKAKFVDYEKKSESIYKIFYPFYKTCRSFFEKELKKMIMGAFGENYKPYIT